MFNPARRLTLCVSLLATAFYCAADANAAAAAGAEPTATAQALCDVLISAMKQGKTLGFAGRVKLLDPELRRLYDMPFVTRLVVGPPWRGMSPDDQQTLVTAFTDYSSAVYASRFKDFSGERFMVDPTTSKAANGDTIVHTKLYPKGSEPVELDYMERQEADGWRVIDVLLNGTISEMAERRSEYASAVRDGGAAGLIKLLHDKTAQLASG